jgi:hypothetical protein
MKLNQIFRRVLGQPKQEVDHPRSPDDGAKRVIAGGEPGRRAPETWLPAKNASIARAWNNPDGLTIPTEWKKTGEALRSRAGSRQLSHSGSNDLPPIGSGQSTSDFYEGHHRLSVSACVEVTSQQPKLKHATVKIPAAAFSTERLDLIQRVGLAIEPEEPAFGFGMNQADVVLYHLAWPADWKTADQDLSLGTIAPMWNPPVSVRRVGAERQTHVVENFHTRLKETRSEQTVRAWEADLHGSLAFMTQALSYLDLQRATDLNLLQTSAVNRLGPDMGGLLLSAVSMLLPHRLGPCPNCGRVVCDDYSGKGVQKRHETNPPAGNPCSWQMLALDAWPLNEDWYFGRFSYLCDSCKKPSMDKLFMRIIHPAPKLVGDKSFMRPFEQFLKGVA